MIKSAPVVPVSVSPALVPATAVIVVAADDEPSLTGCNTVKTT